MLQISEVLTAQAKLWRPKEEGVVSPYVIL
jgi:hypothetical protein